MKWLVILLSSFIVCASASAFPTIGDKFKRVVKEFDKDDESKLLGTYTIEDEFESHDKGMWLIKTTYTFADETPARTDVGYTPGFDRDVADAVAEIGSQVDRCAAGDRERLVVPAGTFDTCHVRGTYDQWVAKDAFLAPIRIQGRFQSHRDRMEKNLDIELVEIKVQ